ncbi:glycoside hydrolase family 15 protein [Natronosalvus rutilus]|uniref:Glucan 1,4-alpha-glucosidase n=1 Tax=Natronosalvus rutilus TaxID=2953753 RepID=A0A9E7NA11_9EURY|nr:glycoside hydrolase family 15 protein [Natronosalvus rutilus]UTF53566.1 glucan 1,4-alpha-glucosidase [Natronosalvus rutilus]
MTLRAALDDYKRHQGSPTVFPGERRTTSGRFSGLAGRTVHVGRDGTLRDFSYPLTGCYGIDRSRFGVRVDGEVRWLDELETTSQSYVDDTALVETTFAGDGLELELERLDLTLDELHVTHVTVAEGSADALAAFVSFAPGGRDDRIGQLVYDDPGVVEVYHRAEHDFLTSEPRFETVGGQLPERLADVLDDEPAVYPNSEETGQYEDGRLGGYVLGFVPFEDGSATVVSRLTDTPDSSAVADDLVERTAALADAEPIREAAPTISASREGSADIGIGTAGPERTTVVDDLRVLGVLSSERGSRMAGPDFDPHYEYSGGYGYTWFRDDAEIARFLLESADALELDIETIHEHSAAFYADVQLEDGTWPHRVWPDDGSLAPGWANDHIGGDGIDYQADQTASVLSYLAAYAGTSDERVREVEPVIERGLEGLDGTLAEDGLPVACQNAWENMAGRFTHTAATFLHAYAAVAAAPIDEELRAHAHEQARAVYRGLDRLWDDDRGIYALRERDGDLDSRLDSSTFALVDAHATYDALESVDDQRRERLRLHVDAMLDGLARETDAVSGLIRFEGDDWRTRTQADEKIWTVSTAWGANAAVSLARLLENDAYLERARDLLAELFPGGSLCLESGYLPEQVFDDGTPDSATPLGWPHALRLATVAQLCELGEPVRPEHSTPVSN